MELPKGWKEDVSRMIRQVDLKNYEVNQVGRMIEDYFYNFNYFYEYPFLIIKYHPPEDLSSFTRSRWISNDMLQLILSFVKMRRLRPVFLMHVDLFNGLTYLMNPVAVWYFGSKEELLKSPEFAIWKYNKNKLDAFLK
jgi:hypothetical protein